MIRAFLLTTLLLTCCVSAVPSAAVAQKRTAATAGQSSASPEEVVRNFYAYYLGELNKDNWEPLKNRREVLKYLTPEFHKRAPALIEKWLADIFICAQDWDEKWAKSFTVGRASVRGTKATTVVRLPPFGGGDDNTAIKIKLTLVQRRGEWRISASDCVN